MDTIQPPTQWPPRPATPGTGTTFSSSERGDSHSEHRSNARAGSVLNDMHAVRGVWIEHPARPHASMIDQFLARMDSQYHVLAETLQRLSDVCTFVCAARQGAVNKDEFSRVISAITSRLASGSLPRSSSARYIQSGDRILRPRTHGHPWLKEESTVGRLGLKPDFFTSRAEWNQATGEYHPVSLSTALHQGGDELSAVEPKSRRSDLTESPTKAAVISDRLVITNSGLFTWDDVQVLWEVKSSSESNNPDVLSGLILEATEVLRYQWRRQFVLGFLVCGVQLRMYRFDRSGVFASLPVDFGDSALVLVKCILAGLVLPCSEIEGFQNPRTLLINGNCHLVLPVDGQEFVLGSQIVGPQRDHLVRRATVVHLARRIEDGSWKYCFKTSQPHAARSHEGLILKELGDIPCVVRLFASDTPPAATLSAEQVCRHYQLHPLASINQTTTTTAPSASSESQKVLGISDDRQSPQFLPREFRQIVTEYLPESFGDIAGNDPLDLLYAWRSLYEAVNAVAVRGWVHRDLSWVNVRIYRRSDSDLPLTVKLIDFDLATRIVGPSTGPPDRTGTPLFMPTEVLSSTDDMPVRHQELHEDEAAFWVGFLALISRSPLGREYINSKLDASRLKFEQLADTRFFMLSALSRKKFWPSWFRTEAPLHPTVVSQSSNILQNLCFRIAQIQFTNEYGEMLDMAYPGVEELDEQSGRRKHALRHEKVFREVVEELGKAIDLLALLRRGDDSNERLKTMMQGLEISRS